MIHLDTESIGFTGPCMLIQTAKNDGPVNLYHVWDNKVGDTLDFIEELLRNPLVIYNATHEAFIFNKWYNVFNKVANKDLPPIRDEIRELELTIDYPNVRCLKPIQTFDLYLFIKKWIYQFTMGRNKKPIQIKFVPIQAVQYFKEILEKWAESLPPIMFEKFKHKYKGDYWEVQSISDNRDFVHFQLTFKPSLALKSVMKHLFKIKISEMKLEQPTDERRKEYRPWNDSWPRLLTLHREYWKTQHGIKYATEDVLHLQKLYHYFQQKKLWPKIDIDSEEAWMIGASRFRGFNIDKIKLQETIEDIRSKERDIPIDHHVALPWLHESMKPDQRWLITNTNTKETLVKIVKMKELGRVAGRAQAIIDQRSMIKHLDILEKLKNVGRYHPNFDVVGTLSNRMAGRGGINPQGISREKSIRSIFNMADDGFSLSGGDFDSQEITILDAIVKDKALRKDLKAGKKIHTLMAQVLYQVEEPDEDQYWHAKQGVYCLIYGGQLEKFAQVTELTVEKAKEGLERFKQKYPEVEKRNEKIYNDFCSMRQPKGLGTNVEWHDPVDFVKSIFNFKRYFIFENKVVKFLFNLANKIPKDIDRIRYKVYRKEREQTVGGATRTALYAAAFRIQAANLRAAGNHEIQSPGATITKILQYQLWQLQPDGINEWYVQPYNVHDEIQCPNCCPDLVEEVVKKTINELREKIPLLSINWKKEMKNWADK